MGRLKNQCNRIEKIEYSKINAQLFAQMRNTDNPRKKELIMNKLIKLNIKIVHDAVHKWNKKSIPFSEDELFTFGMLGLWVAVRNYDLTKGFQFSTFAHNHVNGRILRAIRDEGSLIKIPQKVQLDHSITHKYLDFVSIDLEENPVQLECEYQVPVFNEKIELMLKVANSVRIKGSNLTQAFTDCYNKLIDSGYIDARKDNSRTIIDNGVEVVQFSFL